MALKILQGAVVSDASTDQVVQAQAVWHVAASVACFCMEVHQHGPFPPQLLPGLAQIQTPLCTIRLLHALSAGSH